MTINARIWALAISVFALALPSVATVRGGWELGGSPVPTCPLPLTRSYRIQPGFCPQQLVATIPLWVPGDSCCQDCGPYGIPPIYASGSYVVARQTPEVHERLARFLTDLGAYVPQRPAP